MSRSGAFTVQVKVREFPGVITSCPLGECITVGGSTMCVVSDIVQVMVYLACYVLFAYSHTFVLEIKVEYMYTISRHKLSMHFTA